MKPKTYEAQNTLSTKFSEYERRSLISLTTSELLKFENWTSVKIEISRFSGHSCPGINEGVFGSIIVQVFYQLEIQKKANLLR